MDWYQTGYSYHVDVAVVSPTNVFTTLGLLTGVQLDNCTINDNYYSDSRVQAKVVTVVKDGKSDGYIANARLKIVLSIPSRGWIEPLVTGYVSDIAESKDHGYIKRTYTIEGTIWGLLDHVLKDPVTIGKGAKLINIWTSLMSGQTKMQYDTTGAQDHSYKNTILYEAGTKLGTLLFELSESYDRMDTDGYGVVTLKKYVAPADRGVDRVVFFNQFKNLTLPQTGNTSSEYDNPGRVVVTASVSIEKDGKTTQQVVVGSYDAPSSDKNSIEVRGYLKGTTESYSGVSENPSKSELNTVAKKKYTENQSSGREWDASSVFANYKAGEVIMYVHANLEESKCLVKTVNTNLATMTQDLTLKEV